MLRLACMPKRIHDVIVMTRLSTLFEIFGCVEHAVSEAAERNPAATAAARQSSLISVRADILCSIVQTCRAKSPT